METAKCNEWPNRRTPALDTSERLTRIEVPTVTGMADHLIDASSIEHIYANSLGSVWSTVAGDESRIDGVKIDVQGVEVDVLLGVNEALQRWRPKIVVEVHSGVDRRRIDRIFALAGYADAATRLHGESDSDDQAASSLPDISFSYLP